MNSCVKSNSNRISDSEKTNENQEQANLGHSRNLSSNLMIDDKSDKKVDHQNEQNKKK